MHGKWHDYTVFRVDIPARPEGLSIDRENNDKGYEPGNVRWVTQAVQMANRRNTLRVPETGVAASDVAKSNRVPYGTVRGRLKRLRSLGLPVAENLGASASEYRAAIRAAKLSIKTQQKATA